METVRKLSTAVAALAIGACASATVPIPQAPDTEFLRGCWVSKNEPGGPALGFLRLLPDGPDGDSYRGEHRRAKDGYLLATFSFARDGSRASWRYGWKEEVKALKRSSYVMKDWQYRPIAYMAWDEIGGDMRLEARAENDRLVIAWGREGFSGGIFSGERDGCD